MNKFGVWMKGFLYPDQEVRDAAYSSRSSFHLFTHTDSSSSSGSQFTEGPVDDEYQGQRILARLKRPSIDSKDEDKSFIAKVVFRRYIVKFIMLILTASQILMTSHSLSDFLRTAEYDFQRILVPSFDDLSHYNFVSPVYDIRIVSHVDHVLNMTTEWIANHNRITEAYVDYFQYVNDENTGQPEPAMLIIRNSRDERVTYPMYNSTSMYQVFGDDTPADYLHSIRKWEISSKIVSYQFSYRAVKLQWKLNLIVDLDWKAQGRCVLKVFRKNIGKEQISPHSSMYSTITAMYIVTIFLSVILLLKQLSGFRVYPLSVERYWHHKFVFFIISISADIFNILGASLGIPDSLQENLQLDASVYLFSGLGCMLSCFRILQIFEDLGQEYRGFLGTISSSIPAIFPLIIALMPILMGYAFFGIAFFSDCGYIFSRFGESVQGLFAIWKGDNILVTAQMIAQKHPIIGRIFVYSFITIVLYNWMNIALSRIEMVFFDNVAPIADYQNSSSSSSEAEEDDFFSPCNPIDDCVLDLDKIEKVLSDSGRELSQFYTKFSSYGILEQPEDHDLNSCTKQKCGICSLSNLLSSAFQKIIDDTEEIITSTKQ